MKNVTTDNANVLVYLDLIELGRNGKQRKCSGSDQTTTISSKFK